MRIAMLLVAVVCGCATPGTSNVYEATLGTDARIAGDIMKYGYPGTSMVRYREGYVLSYNARAKTPAWVAERLNAKRLARKVPRQGVTFWVDQTVPDHARSTSGDFEGTAYIRGRMAAASNHLNDKLALKQTYLMSNVAPQLGEEFRQTFWVHFEQKVREWAAEAEDLYVFTGPLFLPEATEEGGKKFVRFQVIGKNQVAVPSHFFKVMVREKGPHDVEVQAFIVPHRPMNGDIRYSDYLVSVDEVERQSGLDFFNTMDDKWQEREESKKPALAWGETADTGAGCAAGEPKKEEPKKKKDEGCAAEGG